MTNALTNTAMADAYATALKEMKDCARFDPESGHSTADMVLCEFLDKLGYGELVEEFHKLTKWYA